MGLSFGIDSPGSIVRVGFSRGSADGVPVERNLKAFIQKYLGKNLQPPARKSVRKGQKDLVRVHSERVDSEWDMKQLTEGQKRAVDLLDLAYELEDEQVNADKVKLDPTPIQ